MQSKVMEWVEAGGEEHKNKGWARRGRNAVGQVAGSRDRGGAVFRRQRLYMRTEEARSSRRFIHKDN
jgi:hypothetical protein